MSTDDASDELVTTIATRSSPTCRSTKPLCATALSMINPKYRERGIAREAWKLQVYHAVDLGYLGQSGRMSVAAPNLIPLKAAMSCELVGLVPYCSYKQAHIDDVIHYLDYHVDERFPEQYKVRQLSLCLCYYSGNFV